MRQFLATTRAPFLPLFGCCAIVLLFLPTTRTEALAQSTVVTSGAPAPSPVDLDGTGGQCDSTDYSATYADGSGHDETLAVSWSWSLGCVGYDPGGGSTSLTVGDGSADGDTVTYACYDSDGGVACTFSIVGSTSSAPALQGSYNVAGTFTPVLLAQATPASGPTPAAGRGPSTHDVGGGPTVTVGDCTVAVGGGGVALAMVTAGGAPAVGVVLSIQSIGGVATATFPLGNMTDASGVVTVLVGGVAAGNTNLVIKATASGRTGTGAVTVAAPAVAVPNFTVAVNGDVLDMVAVTVAGQAAVSVAVAVDTLDVTKATATFPLGNTSDSLGWVFVNVHGVAVTGAGGTPNAINLSHAP